MLCRKCLEPVEYAFSRERGRRYTAEDGPAAETTSVAVGRCPKDGRYSTIYPDDMVRNKQYGLGEIRSVLEGRADYCLASERTRACWRSWYRDVREAVVGKIQQFIGSTLSRNEISIALYAFLKECGDGWLRYVLDIFSTEFNNLCMFFDILGPRIGFGSEKLHGPHGHGGAVAPPKGHKPPPGG